MGQLLTEVLFLGGVGPDTKYFLVRPTDCIQMAVTERVTLTLAHQKRWPDGGVRTCMGTPAADNTVYTVYKYRMIIHDVQ